MPAPLNFSTDSNLCSLFAIVISASAPKMGMFVAIIVAVQIMLAGVYIIYKRRRNSMPKKYL